MKHRILIADDEPDVLQLVSTSFAGSGYDVVKAEDGEEALLLARRERPALAVLDIMMPGLTGLEVMKALKADAATAAIPIILLSARGTENDRVLGLELGAEDFVAKPFSPRELVLRARAILQRTVAPVTHPGLLQVGAIEVDQERHLTMVHGRPAPLTAIEFKLLLALARGAGRMFERETLLTQIWGDEASVDTRTVDTHVRRLRDKLGPACGQLKTVRGFGYRLDHGSSIGEPVEV